ncbi:hypothetical protein BJY01DRAFT_247022 [Aspergillus pseudoustus]|uniref:Uncharacterized protein n=1 Tax=Aspergillus pseudoustus TaxID=1810923 RepID=A0ABR4K3R0_9EURO
MLLLDSIDEPSKKLILELLEQDALDASNSTKGKQRAGMLTEATTDTEAASEASQVSPDEYVTHASKTT